MSNAELLLILTGAKDTETSQILLKEYDGIGHLRVASLEELERIDGIGTAMACKIVAAMELGKRISSAPRRHYQRVICPEDVADSFMDDLRYKTNERFHILLLNVKHEAIRKVEIAVGNLGSAPIDQRVVFKEALKYGASGMILVHNHPSGDPEPSEDDRRVTKMLAKCGELMGVKVIDHVIIGDGVFTSMRARESDIFDTMSCTAKLVSEKKHSEPSHER